MRRNRFNFLLLVAFHLAAFSQPLLVPSIHWYVHHHKAIHTNGDSSVLSHEDTCPINQFHFVHYIGTESEQTAVVLDGRPIVNTQLPEPRFAEFTHFFFLRAPPSVFHPHTV